MPDELSPQWPAEVASIYGIDTSSGTAGQCVGIIAFGGGYRMDDVHEAMKVMGRPDPLVVDVNVNGGANNFEGGSTADLELALDIQIVASLAPGARIAVYFTPGRRSEAAAAVRAAMADSENVPGVLSFSWGAPEKYWKDDGDNLERAFADAVRQRIAIVAAAGDELATAGEHDGLAHVLYPASSPNVLACGGTQIDDGRECVWSLDTVGTGGGISDQFDVPLYQRLVATPSLNLGRLGRGIPDIACLASATAYRTVVGGVEKLNGGTSAAAPFWAALIARANALRGFGIGRIHEQLYRSPNLLRQILCGDNRLNGIGYFAGPDWNACTGLGVPTSGTIEGLAAFVENQGEMHAT